MCSSGSLKQSDVWGGNPFTVGVNKAAVPFCLRSDATLGFMSSSLSAPWTPIILKLFIITVKVRVEIVLLTNDFASKTLIDVFVPRMRTQKPTKTKLVSGSLSLIEVATDGSVFGVNKAGQIL